MHLLALLVAEAVGADSAARLLLPVLLDLRLLLRVLGRPAMDQPHALDVLVVVHRPFDLLLLLRRRLLLLLRRIARLLLLLLLLRLLLGLRLGRRL